MGKAKRKALRPDFREELFAAQGREAILEVCEKYALLRNVEIQLVCKRFPDKVGQNELLQMLRERELVRFIEKKLRPCESIEKRKVLALRFLEEFRRNPDLLHDLGVTLADLQEAKQQRRALEIQQRDQQRLREANEAYAQVLAPLPPTKRLDAILADERAWTQRRAALEAHGLTWDMVEARRALKAERAEAAQRKRVEAKVGRLAEVRARAEAGALAALRIKVSTGTDEKRPVILTTDWKEWLEPYHPVLRRVVERALYASIRGFYRSYSNPNQMAGSAEAFVKLADAQSNMEAQMAEILALAPGAVEQLNRPDAVEISGISAAAFDEAVKRKIIPVAATETFQKWGKTLTAARFEARHVLNFQETESARLFLERRQARIQTNRAAASAKALDTKARRAVMKEEIRREDRARAAAAARRQHSLAAALHVELFTWAQRASRLAKTSPSVKSEAYELKDDALLCLIEAGAATVTFVDARRPWLDSKCKMHSDDFYPMHELLDCSHCRVGVTHHFSLYAIHLTGLEDAGTLHLPYPLGIAAGLPKPGALPEADHGRDEAYGRQLDMDEKAIFSLATIRKEIERLTGVLESAAAEADVLAS